MALADDVITLAGLAQFDFPSATVRLADGGTIKWASDLFDPVHATFGALVEMDPIEEAAGDQAPGGEIALAIPGGVAMSAVFSTALVNSRVRLWLAEVVRATMTVAGTPALLFDGLVDTVGWRARERELVLTLNSRADRLFLRNRGNVAGSAFHKSVWSGEKGFDNCTDVAVPVAWGTVGPPRGVNYGSGGGVPGFGGGGGGGRFFLGNSFQ